MAGERLGAAPGAKGGAGDEVGVTAQECANEEDFLVTIDHA
jgi:hypothetical protein